MDRQMDDDDDDFDEEDESWMTDECMMIDG